LTDLTRTRWRKFFKWLFFCVAAALLPFGASWLARGGSELPALSDMFLVALAAVLAGFGDMVFDYRHDGSKSKNGKSGPAYLVFTVATLLLAVALAFSWDKVRVTEGAGDAISEIARSLGGEATKDEGVWPGHLAILVAAFIVGGLASFLSESRNDAKPADPK
jgi:predicted alpha/beta hydrolase